MRIAECVVRAQVSARILSMELWVAIRVVWLQSPLRDWRRLITSMPQSSRCTSRDIPNILYWIRWVTWPGYYPEFSIMFLEPFQHKSSVVLLEDRRHVRVQLVRSDVQIIRSFHVCSNTTKCSRHVPWNVLQSIIPPPPACVWLIDYWWRNCLLRK